MIRRPPRSTQSRSSAASDVYKRQSDITAALGFTPVNKAGDVMLGNLSLASVTSDPAGLVAGDEGKMWYRSDLNTIRYWLSLIHISEPTRPY